MGNREQHEGGRGHTRKFEKLIKNDKRNKEQHGSRRENTKKYKKPLTFYCRVCDRQMGMEHKNAHKKDWSRHKKERPRYKKVEPFYCHICDTQVCGNIDKETHENERIHCVSLAKYLKKKVKENNEKREKKQQKQNTLQSEMQRCVN